MRSQLDHIHPRLWTDTADTLPIPMATSGKSHGPTTGYYNYASWVLDRLESETESTYEVVKRR